MAANSSKGRIVVTGMAFFLPLPGVVYQVLHYLIGLRRLGYDAYYVEESDRWVYDSTIDDVVDDASANVSIVGSLLDNHGFAGRWTYRGKWDRNGCYGIQPAQLAELYHEADGLLNVTGQEISDDQLICPVRVYIESDPFASQVKVHDGDLAETARLAAHNVHFTFGENIGASDCLIPATPFAWMPTRQPVDIDTWTPPADTRGNRQSTYTSVTSWVNHVDSVELGGERYYWQKDREFQKFADLPSLTEVEYELASNGGEHIPDVMRSSPWRHVPVADVAGNARSYRDYIFASRAEFTVARDQYTRPRTGWFSDRSACYLAAGRPVITQETGFSRFLPAGRGLFAFNAVEDILAATDAIESDYEAHCAAAREIASEYFSADKVVASLMERAGL